MPLSLGVGVAGLHQEVHLGRHRDRVGLLQVAGIGRNSSNPVGTEEQAFDDRPDGQ